MRSLKAREKRTIRIAAFGVGIYLIVFFCFMVCKGGSSLRAEYDRLYREAVALKRKFAVYEDKAIAVSNMMAQFRFDPTQLSRTTIVAQATAAIYRAAMSGGIQLGPIRETPARAAAKELSAVQLEGIGQVPAILRFIHGMETLGYPLVMDSLQLTPESRQPGQVKVNMTIVILDFEQWSVTGTRPDV
jgi:hypothetical protein